MEKLSYERRAYESVDDGSPSWVPYQKWTEIKICSITKGLQTQRDLWHHFSKLNSKNFQSYFKKS